MDLPTHPPDGGSPSGCGYCLPLWSIPPAAATAAAAAAATAAAAAAATAADKAAAAAAATAAASYVLCGNKSFQTLAVSVAERREDGTHGRRRRGDTARDGGYTPTSLIAKSPHTTYSQV